MEPALSHALPRATVMRSGMRATTALLIFAALACGGTPSGAEQASRAAPIAKSEPSSVVQTKPASTGEHALLIEMPFSDESFGTEVERERVYALEDALGVAVSKARVGMVDGHEFGGGKAVLFLYGSDADALYGTVEPLLRAHDIARGATITRRYGPASDPEAREVATKLAPAD